MRVKLWSSCAARVEANELACRAFLATPTMRAAVEHMFLLPCPLLHTLLCAGRSDYVIGDILKGQQLPSEP